jgi:hypothetical protein
MRESNSGYPSIFHIFVTFVSAIALVMASAFMMWFVGCTPPVFGLEDPKTTYIAAPTCPQTDATSYYYDHDLNDAQKKAYCKIENAIRVMSDGVILDEPLSVLETTRACNAVLSDNPDIFWLAKEGSKYAKNRSGVYMLKFSYTCSPDEVAAKVEAYEKTVKDVLSKIKEKDETGKARAITEYVTANTDYVDGDLSHSIEGAIGERAAVCSGYSKTVKYMCDIEGIPCIYVHGYIGADPFANHAWNEIRADGVLYSADATWHESSEDEQEWFSSDIESFSKNRTPSFMGVTECFEKDRSSDKI